MLSEENVDYAVYGTYGLIVHRPHYINTLTVTDCDLLLANDTTTILKVLGLLHHCNYKVKVWDAWLSKDYNYADHLAGKYYARTMIGGFQVDLTYEHNYSTAYNESLFLETGLKICEEKTIIEMKKQTGREKDFLFLSTYYPDA